MFQMLRFCWLALALPLLEAQEPQPAFEVASVKAVSVFAQNYPSRRIIGGPGTTSPGTIEYREHCLKDLVFMAYRVQLYQLPTPSWMADAFFTIQARVPSGATREDVSLMLQRLLAERFNLRIHREQKEMQGYSLTVAKNGPTIQKSPEFSGKPAELFSAGKLEVDSDGFAVFPTGVSTILAIPGKDGLARLTAARTSMASFCGYLRRLLQQPVVDETGLVDVFDFRLKYIPDIATPGNADLNALPSEREGLSASAPAPTIPMAISTQLGLRVQSQKVMTEFLDHIARIPTEN